jgi:5-formyltetrahydrofolate cyclo-ligase
MCPCHTVWTWIIFTERLLGDIAHTSRVEENAPLLRWRGPQTVPDFSAHGQAWLGATLAHASDKRYDAGRAKVISYRGQQAMAQSPEEIRSAKRTLRKRIGRLRNALSEADKERLSRLISGHLIESPCYRTAQTVMLYVNLPDEVRTGQLLRDAAERGKKVVIPYCVGDRLELFCIEGLDELAVGTFGVLEPKPQLRGDPARMISPKRLDLIVVPGVAFDRQGGRLGRGKGYYDGLLCEVRRDTFLVAPAFECQIVDRVPTQPHDVPIHQIITEKKIHSPGG